LRSNHTKLIPQKESVKNTHKTSHLSDKVTHQKESVKKANNPKIGDALGPKATKNPIPSDKVPHQGTTAAKACCVGIDPSQKVGKKDKATPKRYPTYSPRQRQAKTDLRNNPTSSSTSRPLQTP
jgi:hypothetical protein